MMDRLFALMNERQASDMLISSNSAIHLKINGSLVPINQQKMMPDDIMALLSEVAALEQIEELKTEGELNISISVREVGSFRLSAFRQRGSYSMVVRYIPGNIPRLETLNLPAVLGELIMEKRGLILLVGATGAGKSTTIASMLDYRNELKSGHILTLEDPIEFLFSNKKSIVNQREVGTDCKSLYIALKNSMRQAPDCIFIGEIRDRDTMSLALTYAQAGHLVVATLHANNTYRALNRIISFFPLENRPTLLGDLSSTLKAIVSQRLVRSVHGGRLPATEILINTRHVEELIETGQITQIREAIEKSISPGSQTFEQALMHMIQSGLISKEEGISHADSPSNLLWMLDNQIPELGNMQSGIQPSAGGAAQHNPFTEFKLNL